MSQLSDNHLNGSLYILPVNQRSRVVSCALCFCVRLFQKIFLDFVYLPCTSDINIVSCTSCVSLRFYVQILSWRVYKKVFLFCFYTNGTCMQSIKFYSSHFHVFYIIYIIRIASK